MASDVSSSVDNGEASGTQYGGYDFEFVQGMDDNLEDMFMCKICHLPSCNAQLSLCCGHTFCKSWLDKIKQVELAALKSVQYAAIQSSVQSPTSKWTERSGVFAYIV